MNHLKLLGLCLACFIACSSASAQSKVPINEPDTKRPKLFTELPDRIPVDIMQIKNLLTGTSETGKEVTVSFSNKSSAGLSGKVISDVSKYDNTLRTLLIRSSNFSGATLTLSSSTQPDGTVNYTGRIISFKHGDLYELEKQNDQYFLIKKNFTDLVNE